MKQKLRANKRTFFIVSPKRFCKYKITDKSKKVNLIYCFFVSRDEIIDDFLDAKKSLNTVCKLAKRMNSKNVPVVKEIINAYLDFFVKADAICMTVAKYARNINREAEKTLGHKSDLQNNIGGNNKNTYLYMREILTRK